MGEHETAAAPALALTTADEERLWQLGIELAAAPPTPAGALSELLEQVADCLRGIKFSGSVIIAIGPVLKATVREELLKHEDEDVKVLMAFCFCEITRITMPDVPYTDDVLREIFYLIVGTFNGLSDVNSRSFGWRVGMLETLERSRLCVVMLDVECDDLITDMFQTFLKVISDDHEENIFKSMQTIMASIIDECDEVQGSLLLVLLSALGWKKTGAAMSARKLAYNVIEQSAGKLEPYLKTFLTSSLTGDSSSSDDHIDHHGIILDVYQCSPKIHEVVVPYITGELLADAADIRSKAVELVGKLFSLPGPSTLASLEPLFPVFLDRLTTDTVVEVRISVIRNLKKCLISNHSNPKAPKIMKALCDRLLDHDENVGKEVVAALYDVVCHSFSAIPVDIIKMVADHVHNKSLALKWYTMERMASIYKLFCMKGPGSMNSGDFEWIPGKILKCLYKDFRPESVESILCDSLFPPEFSTRSRVKHWVIAVSQFDEIEMTAFEQILLQKQRLQQEMLKYMSLRTLSQEDDPDLQKIILKYFHSMSHLFSDPEKWEESMNILHQLKDTDIWKIFSGLLDCSTTFKKAWSLRVDLLNILGEKHALCDFVSTLAMRCSYSLFNKEYAKDLLLEARDQKSAGNTKLISSCMDLLTAISSFFPSLLYGLEEDIIELLMDLKEDNAGNGDNVSGLKSAAADISTTTSELGRLNDSRKRRKRKSICVLAKCSAHDLSSTDLVGHRIKVWWPLDKTFYEGTVQSYNSSKEKHTVLYDDGYTEVLNLAKEKWKISEDNNSSMKQKDYPGTRQGQ